MDNNVPIDFEGVTFQVPRSALTGWAVSNGQLRLGLSNFTGSIVVQSSARRLITSPFPAPAVVPQVAQHDTGSEAAVAVVAGAGAVQHGVDPLSLPATITIPDLVDAGASLIVPADLVAGAAAGTPPSQQVGPLPRKRKALQRKGTPPDVIVIEDDASPLPRLCPARSREREAVDANLGHPPLSGGNSQAKAGANSKDGGRSGGGPIKSDSQDDGGTTHDSTGSGGGGSGNSSVVMPSSSSANVVDGALSPGQSRPVVLVPRAHSFVISTATRPRRSRLSKGIQGLRREVESFSGGRHGVVRAETVSMASNKASVGAS
jgi:hypothetical protein